MKRYCLFVLMVIISLILIGGASGFSKRVGVPAEKVRKAPISGTKIGRDFFGVDIMHFSDLNEKVYKGRDIGELLKLYGPSLKEMGVGLVGINLNWREVEPSAPSKGKHSYNWDMLDRSMEALYRNGLKAKLQIFPSAPWATKQPVKELNRSGPLKKKHESDWKDFIQALTERYDGDGKGDAFSMSYPVLAVVNVSGEVEASNNWRRYGGSPAEYDDLLSSTFKYINDVSPEVYVARSAVNFGDAFDGMLTSGQVEALAERAKNRQELNFFLDSIEDEDNYDLLGMQFNYSWSGIVPEVQWVSDRLREYGYSKPLFGNHVRSTPVDVRLESALLDKRSANYEKAKAYYLAEQSNTTVKKLTVGLANGLEFMLVATVFDGGLIDIPQVQKLRGKKGISWVFNGFYEGEAVARGITNEKARKPVFYSYKLFVDKISGAERKVVPVDLGANIYAYKFSKGGKELYVMWYEDVRAEQMAGRRGGASKSVELPVDAKRATLTHLITRNGQTSPETESLAAKGGRLTLKLTSEPVILEVEG